MLGSVSYQVRTLYLNSGINQIKESKQAAKEQVRADFEAMGKHASWHDLGQNMGIFSLKTADDYQAVWEMILESAKEHDGMRDIEGISADQVARFLDDKVEQGVKKSTFDAYAAAAEKLGVALNWYSEKFDRGNQYDFSEKIKDVRNHAREELDKTQAARAYSSPRSLVAAIERPDHQLAASIQLEAGSRVREVSNIKEKDLLGLAPDKVSGQMMGWYRTRGKGGKELEKMLCLETYQKLEQHIREHGALRINGNSYRDSIKEAARETKQEYYGSHGLRWNFAQERYREVQECGQTSYEALKTVSEDMGHNRVDITLHYLHA